MLNDVIFDLDGTLSDSAEGIVGSFRHALKELDIPDPGDEVMQSVIGHNVQSSFSTLLGVDDPELIAQALRHFRQYFRERGIYQNTLYDGVSKLLSALEQQGMTLHIATLKPEVFALKVLEQSRIHNFFKGVVGPGLDAKPDQKALLLDRLIETHNIKPEAAVMVGDRGSDIEAGKICGMLTVGVSYGYGTADELYKLKADAVCHDIEELERTLKKLANPSSCV